MGFSVGDKVMHPRFGAGKITGEEHRELVEGFEHYYVIQVLGTGATAYVPIRKMVELGVRLVMSRSKLNRVLETLRDTPSVLPSDYKERQGGVQEKLQSGHPIPVAEAVRDLTWRRKRKRLTLKDETLLNRGKDLLASEMALATDSEIVDAQETIDFTLRLAMEYESDASEDGRKASTAATGVKEPFLRKLLGRVANETGV